MYKGGFTAHRLRKYSLRFTYYYYLNCLFFDFLYAKRFNYHFMFEFGKQQLQQVMCFHNYYFFFNSALCCCARTRYVIEFEICFAMALIPTEGESSSKRMILS